MSISSSASYLTSLFSGMTNTDPLLQAIYGQNSSAPSGSADIQAYNNDLQNQTADIAATAATPTVQQAISQFTAGVKDATSVKQLLSNPAVMNVLLTANGMSDQIGYTGLAIAALTSNLSDPSSLANTLTDTRWKTAAANYNFATAGLSVIQNPATIKAISQAYAQTVWEQNQNTANPGIANALAFQQQASSITSVDQILGNSTLRTVVTVALGIPDTIAIQPLEAQERAISSRLNVSRLQQPQFVTNLIQQYLLNNASNNAATSSATPDLTTLAVQAGGILA
jgi:RNase H-fold protein (predicted Holliday junction resolvase)